MATHRLRRDLGHCLDFFFFFSRLRPALSAAATKPSRWLRSTESRSTNRNPPTPGRCQVVLSKTSPKEPTRSATSDAAAHYAVTAGLVCESLGHHPTCPLVLPSRAYTDRPANVSKLFDSTRFLEKRDVENEKPGRLRLSLRREFGPVSNSTARTLFSSPFSPLAHFSLYRKTLQYPDATSVTRAITNCIAGFVHWSAQHANRSCS